MRKFEARANFYLLLLNTTGGQLAQLIDLIVPFSVIVARECWDKIIESPIVHQPSLRIAKDPYFFTVFVQMRIDPSPHPGTLVILQADLHPFKLIQKGSNLF